MTWTGDLSRMDHLVDRLHDLAGVPSRASQKIAFRLNDLLLQEFETGRDPYDSPWAELSDATIAKGRTPPPLTASSEMRDSVYATPMAPAGVSLTVAAPAAAHQKGWRGPLSSGPARPILPMRSELPLAWREVIREEVAREFQR